MSQAEAEVCRFGDNMLLVKRGWPPDHGLCPYTPCVLRRHVITLIRRITRDPSSFGGGVALQQAIDFEASGSILGQVVEFGGR